MGRKQENRKKIKNFFKNSEKMLILKRENDYDAVSEWWRVRNPLRTISNYILIQLAKIAPFMWLRKFLWRVVGVKIGKNVGFAQVDLDPLCSSLLSIEENVILGWKVKILCHEFIQNKMRFGRIKVGKNSLVGSFSVLRSGVNIGKNSVVCMNSFVNKDVPDNEMWGGVPARKIKKLTGEI